MKQVIGIDRRIRRQWLDQLLDRFVTTADEKELRGYLDEQLRAELPGAAARKKTRGILWKVWCGVPEDSCSLRQRALLLLPRISGQERLWLHWGMMALAYPFFRDIVELVGRLLALQDDFSSVAVLSRLTASWGDRTTTRLAAKHVLRMLVEWEVLRPKQRPGEYLLVQKLRSDTPELQLWLLEALLGASAADEIEAQQLLRLPDAFPFSLTIGLSELRRHEGFNLHRQGLDMDMVALRPVRLTPPTVAVPGMGTAVAVTDKPIRRRRTSLFDELGADDLPTPARQTPPSAIARPPKTGRRTARERRVEQLLRDDFRQSLDDRISRTLALSVPSLPLGPWTAALEETTQLYRTGHHLGCLALGQPLLESLIRHLATTRVKRPPARHAKVEKLLEVLVKKRVLSEDLRLQAIAASTSRPPLQQSAPASTDAAKTIETTAAQLVSTLWQLARAAT